VNSIIYLFVLRVSDLTLSTVILFIEMAASHFSETLPVQPVYVWLCNMETNIDEA
jgi:hypothetical protein